MYDNYIISAARAPAGLLSLGSCAWWVLCGRQQHGHKQNVVVTLHNLLPPLFVACSLLFVKIFQECFRSDLICYSIMHGTLLVHAVHGHGVPLVVIFSHLICPKYVWGPPVLFAFMQFMGMARDRLEGLMAAPGASLSAHLRAVTLVVVILTHDIMAAEALIGALRAAPPGPLASFAAKWGLRAPTGTGGDGFQRRIAVFSCC
jgi:hypothetical protein